MKKKTIRTNNKGISPGIIVAAILVMLILTLGAYYPGFSNTFTNYDERAYVTENPMIRKLSMDIIAYHFSDFYMGNYHPLTMISYTLDYALFGLQAERYIQVNLFWHCISCIFIFLLVWEISKNVWGAGIAGIFFALHPLHVESVVWIAERKDVLYTAFLTAALYIAYKGIQLNKKIYYHTALLLFLMACLSKGMAVVFTPVFILTFLFYHKQKEGRWNGFLWLKKEHIFTFIPFIIVSIIFGIIAIKAQASAEAIRTDLSAFPMLALILFPFYGLWFYIQKMVLPWPLSAHYGYPEFGDPLLYLAPVFLGLTGFVAWYYRKNLPEILYAFLFYLFSIVIVLQIIPVGKAIAADRYFYFASVGFAIALGLGIGKRVNPKLSILLIALCTAFWFWKTRERIAVWKDSVSLWTDTLKENPRVPFVLFNLGVSLEKKGKEGEQRAMELYKLAIQTDPSYFEPYNNLGILLNQYGRSEEAIPLYEKAMRMKPEHSDTYNNYATALQALKQYDASLENFRKSIALKKDNASPHNNIGTLLNELGRFDEAIVHYREAARLSASEPRVWYNLGNLFFQQGLPDSAEAYYLKSLSLKPDYPDAMGNLGVVYFNRKEYDTAISWYQKAIQANPEFKDGYYNLGVVYYFKNDPTASMENFRKAAALGHPGAVQWINSRQ